MKIFIVSIFVLGISFTAGAGEKEDECNLVSAQETVVREQGRLADEHMQALARRRPIDQLEAVTRSEVIAARAGSTYHDPGAETYEAFRPAVTQGPVAKAFLDLFSWSIYFHQPDPDRIATFRAIEGIPVSPGLGSSVKVESEARSFKELPGVPGYQDLTIDLKISGATLAKLMKFTEEHHLNRNNMTLDQLRAYGEKYRQLDYAAFRAYPRGMWELGDFDRFVREHPLTSRAINMAVSEAGNESEVKMVSHDHSPLGIMEEPGKRPPASIAFVPDPNKMYDVMLAARPDILPRSGSAGRERQNNYATNRYLLMQFFMEKVVPLLGRG